jgi:propanol-preferring alcohol dehydrogenase
MVTTMKAFKLVKWGQPGQYVDVPIPAPGAGEVLVKISAVGLCRSDLDMVDSAPGSSPYANSIPDGYTLGHENVGRVTILGYGVTDIHKDEAVAVHHMRHCGNCEYCSSDAEQHCESFKRNAIGMTRGCGLDGGLAEYLVVPRTELISLGDRDPIPYAPLTDAGVTAYHAVQTMISRLRPGTCAAVIGIGGLGVYGLQFLKLLSPARIFALDVLPARLKLSKEPGADYVIQSDKHAADTILRLTNGRGVHAVIDLLEITRHWL